MAACVTEKPRTQVMAIIDADQSIRADTAALRVEIRGRAAMQTFWSDALVTTFDSSRATWPWPIAIVPAGGDASRKLEVLVVALDAAGDEIVQSRAVTGFVEGRTLMLGVRLTDPCRRVDCSDETTCRGGECVDPYVPPETLPEYTGAYDGGGANYGEADGSDGARLGDAPSSDAGPSGPSDARPSERDGESSSVYCPPLPAPAALTAGTCSGVPAGTTFTLTVEVTRGRTFLDLSSEDTDAVGRLVVMAFDDAHDVSRCEGCRYSGPETSATLWDADLSDPSAPAVVTLHGVPSGGTWLLAYLDDNDNGTPGASDSIDVGDLLTPVSQIHTTCADETVSIELAHRFVTVGGTMSVSGAVSGAVTGTLGLFWFSDARSFMTDGQPIAMSLSDADLSVPVAWTVSGQATLGASAVTLIVAPASLYFLGVFDRDYSGFMGPPTSGDLIAAELGDTGLSAIEHCLDDTSIEFARDVVFNYVAR